MYAARVSCILLVAPLLGACATTPERFEENAGEPLRLAQAVYDARAELPGGVILTDRRIALNRLGWSTVAAPDSATARAALAAAFEVADSVGRLLDVFRSGSEIQAINQAAGREPVRVSPWTEAALTATLDWAERSGGAIDPSVGPLLDLWGFGRGEARVPDEAAIAAARRLVGWSRVQVDTIAHTVFLPDSGMKLDMSAAMRGFALDRMKQAMLGQGATSGFVDLDGDVIFFGPGTEGTESKWPIQFPNPYEPDRPFAVFSLPEGAASTSSSLTRTVQIGNRRYTHLIDPRTGRPVEVGLISVSVYAGHALPSDLLATTLFVLGPREGPKLIERWPGVEAIFVTDAPPGSSSVVIVTTGLEEHRRWLEPPYRARTPED